MKEFASKAFALMTMALLCAPNGWAQDYPNKPIKVILPLVAGGSTDATARIVTNRLSARLRQPAVTAPYL